MKKALLTGLIITLTAGLLTAQQPAPTTPAPTEPAPVQNGTTATPTSDNYKFRLGISASPVLSWFNPEGDPNTVSGNGVRFGVNYGLNMAFRIGANPNYYFHTGLFVMHTGGTLNHDYAVTPPNQTALSESEREAFFRLNYLNIPLTFLMRTNEIGYIKYFARVGFDAGINIKANADITDNVGTTALASNEQDMGDFVNLFRTALHIELGLFYNLTGNTDLAISLEWNNGLNNVFNDKYRLPVTDANGNTTLTGGRIKSITNALLLNTTLYF